MVPGLAVELREQLAEQGVKVPAGSIPLGVTKNGNGDAVLYYRGSDLLPEYVMNTDSLIGSSCDVAFEERKEGVEYFWSFEWDTLEAGFVDLRRADGELVRHYLVQHQPTELSSLEEGDERKRWWFRKIEATLLDRFEGVKVVVKLWEKFERTEENARTGF